MTKPMLAVAADFTKIKYPVYASPKLDGIRCLIIDGVAKTRTLKDIPNKAIQAYLSSMAFDGLDGELIVGPPTAKDVYTRTVSQVMAHDKGTDNVTFHVFDRHDHTGPFADRYASLIQGVTETWNPQPGVVNVNVLGQVNILNEEELLAYETECVELGFEGIILRAPRSPYKYGRSTVNEGYLLKCKRFSDSEAEIIGFDEEMFNGNAAVTNELGRTKRSTAAVGLVGKGTLGAFNVRDRVSGIEFSIGTGLTAAQRADFWTRRDALLGSLIKYKFFPVGVKVAPRHPVYLGFRDRADL